MPFSLPNNSGGKAARGSVSSGVWAGGGTANERMELGFRLWSVLAFENAALCVLLLRRRMSSCDRAGCLSGGGLWSAFAGSLDRGTRCLVASALDGERLSRVGSLQCGLWSALAF